MKEKPNIIEKKSGGLVNLKTTLEDVPINPKIKKIKMLSVSELINQPENVKKNFLFHHLEI